MDSTQASKTSPFPKYALDLINEVAVSKGFVAGYTISHEAGSKHGDGFQGTMIRVHIQGKRSLDASIIFDQISVICKMTPLSELKRNQFGTTVSFGKEVYTYTKILPAFENFQQAHGLDTRTGFFAFPQCYGTYSNAETGDFVIIMEDIQASGYTMVDKVVDTDFAQAEAVIRQMGRFHGVSLALKKQQPEVFEEFKRLQSNALENMAKEESKPFYSMFYGMAIDTLEPSEVDLIAKMTDLKGTYFERMRECFRADALEPYGVINHGDIWSNNLMYRYKDGGELQDVCILDWQTVQYGSPALDFSLYLFSAVQKTIRDLHYDDLVATYYESLSETIRHLGSDSEELLGRENFLDQLKRYSKYGLIMSATVTSAMCLDPNEIPDFDAMDINNFDPAAAFAKNLLYKSRMSALIKDFFQMNYNW